MEEILLKQITITPVINTVISIVKSQYKDKNFVINIKPNTSSILADKDKFEQILTNIIENAAKYGDENSTIYIDAENKTNTVSIKVTNSGIEINQNDYNKIFTKFSRIDNPLTRKVQGSGLGLYITKNLVEKMGGSISVTSANHQTTFEIQLPASNIELQAREKCSR